MDGDFAYIGRQLARPLVAAIAEVCDVRPADPIGHISNFLQLYHLKKKNEAALKQKEYDKKKKLAESRVRTCIYMFTLFLEMWFAALDVTKIFLSIIFTIFMTFKLSI